MARRAIGLDIGTFAVRAAELVFSNTGPKVVRFGQLTLPNGAVVAGEVIDTHAVAATLRRLWDGAGFRGREVVLGLANQKVFVREAEMTAMSDEDLAAAFQFQDAEILPVSPDEAYVDFQRLEDLLDAEGNQRVRLLVAAAQKSMVAAHLEALELAGLRALRLDPLPLALVRSIGTSGLATLEEGASCEALVCIGAGVTTIVVHEGGIPRFVRFLPDGSAAATEAVMEALGTEFDQAEAAKRAADAPPEILAALVPAVDKLVEEIRSSIAFYIAQHPECPVGRVILAGGGSRTRDLPERLSRAAGLPVSLVQVASMYEISAGLSQDEIARAEPNLPTVIGLALASVAPASGVRRINLMPPSVTTARVERVQAAALGGVVAALAVILILIWMVKGSQVSDEQNQATADAAQQQALQQKVSSLTAGRPSGLPQAADQDIRSALAGDVDWASLITRIADAMPSDVWLTTFTGSRNPSGGTVTFAGMGFDQTSAAQWLTDVGQLGSLANLWVSSAARTGQDDLISFSSTAALGPGASAGSAARIQRYTGSGTS
jgi:type IV pilus assembly protein PilM